jgi:hypothetical protein
VIDAAQGERKGADSFAACVAHDEVRGERRRVAVQDALFEAVPPFSPRAVIADIALLAQRYRITRVHGDAHAKGFVAELLREHGLTFVELERDRSALYLDALAMLNSGQAVLLDHPKQRRQILALRRALHSGGRISVDHPRGGHDDVANVGLAALVVALGVEGKRPRRSVAFSFGEGIHTPDDPHGTRRPDQGPGKIEHSERRQQHLERLLTGDDPGFGVLRGILDGSGAGPVERGGGSPFERSTDDGGSTPFNRR